MQAGADSIKKVVFRSIYAIQNASIQSEAMKMGTVLLVTSIKYGLDYLKDFRKIRP